MKRRTLKFIACAAVMALTLSVTACGGSDNSSNSNTSVAENTKDVKEDVSAPEADEEKEEEVNTAEEEETKVPEAEEETEAEEEEEEESSLADAQTLEDYFSDPTLKDMYDSMLEAMSEEGISLSYEVSGNDFVMIFTITDSDYLTDEMADGLAEALETQGDQFKTQAAQFDSILEGNGTCTVTIRYTDPDGNVMAEKTFTAD